ncbi:PP2C family protein-serine/threonine phosphatase [Streptomyces sp. NRRL S-1448]|uniref:PP2C family protein-serine/threonine phosphatase n=1 Tax=Streptomyces sp. NRRL S-1448 TaxID=1463883 RepID=UPI00068D5A31|nr:PP2C family protein-serine/threonine phosphatase [Streptomyces sp. NRRL S-1448]
MNRDGSDNTGQDAEGTRLRARLRATEEAVERIGTTLDARTTCTELSRFLCRHIGDAAAVELLPEDATAARRPAEAPALRRVASAGLVKVLEARFPADHPESPAGPESPASPESSERLEGSEGSEGSESLEGPGDGSPLLRALAEDRPVTARAVLSGGMSAQALAVPLSAQGRRHGALIVLRAGGSFSADETATVLHAARLAAAHLTHARRHSSVQRTAMDLQRALLAEPGRPHPNLELATRYLPSGSSALVGGDWFETVRLHYGRTLLVMGDVMGHGLDAAVDMNAYRSSLRYVASTDLPPHRVLRQLDTAVAEDESRRPATCLLARVDPARSIAAFASAGHLSPVVFGGDGTADLLRVPVGPPLGTGTGGYEQITRTLTPDDTLLMFTDGLVERRGEDIDTSLSRLSRLRLPAGADVEQVLDEVLDHLDGLHAEDDVAVLAARIRRHPEASGREEPVGCES